MFHRWNVADFSANWESATCSHSYPAKQLANGEESDIEHRKSTGCGKNAGEYQAKIAGLRSYLKPVISRSQKILFSSCTGVITDIFMDAVETLNTVDYRLIKSL